MAHLLRLNLFIFIALLSTLTQADDSWQLFKSVQEEGIDIYYRSAPEAPDFIEFKAVMLLESKLLPAIAVIRDVSSMPEWVYQVKSAEIIERIDDVQRYIHIKHNSPVIGLGKRDSIILSSIRQDPLSKVVIIEGLVQADYRERNKGYVRIESGKSSWIFEPLADEQIKITFQGYANPGGLIKKAASGYLAKKFLWKLPYISMKNLKQQVKKPRYQNVQFPGIVEAF